MADKPIIFSSAMVRALLEGRKSQTRRVLKPQPPTPEQFPGSVFGFDRSVAEGVKVYSLNNLDRLPKHPTKWDLCGSVGVARDAGFPTTYVVPFAVGDRLWVRETWAVGNIYDGVSPSKINPTGEPGWCGIRYAATDERLGIRDRASIHMPRWASRITLDVTDVRVQRLQDISDDDCFAEGLEKLDVTLGRNGEVVPLKQPMAANEWPQGEDGARGHAQDGWDWPWAVYADLWESLHGRGSWKANPFVAAITFSVTPANIDSLPETGGRG